MITYLEISVHWELRFHLGIRGTGGDATRPSVWGEHSMPEALVACQTSSNCLPACQPANCLATAVAPAPCSLCLYCRRIRAAAPLQRGPAAVNHTLGVASLPPGAYRGCCTKCCSLPTASRTAASLLAPNPHHPTAPRRNHECPIAACSPINPCVQTAGSAAVWDLMQQRFGAAVGVALQGCEQPPRFEVHHETVSAHEHRSYAPTPPGPQHP